MRINEYYNTGGLIHKSIKNRFMNYQLTLSSSDNTINIKITSNVKVDDLICLNNDIINAIQFIKQNYHNIYDTLNTKILIRNLDYVYLDEKKSFFYFSGCGNYIYDLKYIVVKK